MAPTLGLDPEGPEFELPLDLHPLLEASECFGSDNAFLRRNISFDPHWSHGVLRNPFLLTQIGALNCLFRVEPLG